MLQLNRGTILLLKVNSGKKYKGTEIFILLES